MKTRTAVFLATMICLLESSGSPISAQVQPASAKQDGPKTFVDVSELRSTGGEGAVLAFQPRPGRFLMKVKRGWSGVLLFSGEVDGAEWGIIETTGVGARPVKSQDGTDASELFPSRDPILEAVSLDDGCKFLAVRKGTATLRYYGAKTEQELQSCELRVEVEADTSEIDAAIKEAIPLSHVKVIEVRSAALLSGTVPTDDDLRLIAKIAEQFYPEIILQVKVDGGARQPDSLSIPTGMRILTCPFSATMTGAGQLQPGHYVDINAVIESRTRGGEMRTRVEPILQGIQVFAVGEAFVGDGKLGVSFLVFPRQGQLLQFACQQSHGALQFALRAEKGVSNSRDLTDQTLTTASNRLMELQPTNSTKADRDEQPVPARERHTDVSELRALRAEVRAMHEDVRRLTSLLQKQEKPKTIPEPSSAGLPAAPPSATKAAAATRSSAVEVQIQKSLAKTVTVNFQDTALGEALRNLGEQIDVNIVLDSRGLAEEGLTPAQPVSFVMDGISARSAFKLILEPLELAVVIENEVLKVTSRQRAKGEMIVVSYPLRELIQSLELSRDSMEAVQQLIEVIQLTISPDTWDLAGGPGAVHLFEQTQHLVVRQTDDVHAEIVKLLDEVRSSKRLPSPKSHVSKNGKYHSQSSSAEPVVVTYAVADLIVPVPSADSPRRTPEAADWFQLIEKVTQVDPDVWEVNDGPCSIRVHDTTLSLVIRAPQSTHKRIAKLLDLERSKQDINIQFETKFLQTTDERWRQQPEFEIQFDSVTHSARLSQEQADAVLKEVTEFGGTILPGRSVTSMNGTTARIPSSQTRDRKSKSPAIYLRGLTAPDGESLKLNVAVQPHSLVQELIGRPIKLLDGQSLLIDVTEPTRRDDLGLADNGRRLYVLIHPKVIVAPQEEQK